MTDAKYDFCGMQGWVKGQPSEAEFPKRLAILSRSKTLT
jgi:hypothetical protein